MMQSSLTCLLVRGACQIEAHKECRARTQEGEKGNYASWLNRQDNLLLSFPSVSAHTDLSPRQFNTGRLPYWPALHSQRNTHMRAHTHTQKHTHTHTQKHAHTHTHKHTHTHSHTQTDTHTHTQTQTQTTTHINTHTHTTLGTYSNTSRGITVLF